MMHRYKKTICTIYNLSSYTPALNGFITFKEKQCLNICSKYRLNYCTIAKKDSCILNLSGIFPPITTPFNNDESIAYDRLENNLQKWNKLPFKGYTVLGSNGETPYLRLEEKLALIRTVSENSGPDHIIMAGCGAESTRDTIMMTEHAAQAGAHCALILTPNFYRNQMSPASFKQHFSDVADRSPVPVVLYNVPGNTALDLDVDTIVCLSQHPNIIGLKDSGGDITKLSRIIHETRDQDFQVLAGSAGFLLPALYMGCVGGVCALANALGEEVCKLHSLHHSLKHQEGLELQRLLISPNTAVTKTHGVAGLKRAMDLMGYFGGPTRRPLLPLTEPERSNIDRIFNPFIVNEDM